MENVHTLLVLVKGYFNYITLPNSFAALRVSFFLPHIRMFLPGVTQSGKRIKIVRAVTAAVNCKRKKRKSCLPTTLLRG